MPTFWRETIKKLWDVSRYGGKKNGSCVGRVTWRETLNAVTDTKHFEGKQMEPETDALHYGGKMYQHVGYAKDF